MRSRRTTLLKLLIPLFTIAFCLLALEVGVRLLSTRDEDGNIWVRFSRLKPYHLPVRRIEREVSGYAANAKSALTYDPDLGWSQRPSVAEHNSAGFISVAPEVPKEPSPDRLRIALFGDSFTQGTYEDGWWRVLEEDLNQAGVKAEVLNFGVGGYGMDQAYLRWRKDGAPYRPQIVIFGFLADDCLRNVNLLRLMRDPTSGIALMKPRFILDGDDGLKLINSPTPRPEEVAGVVRQFGDWPLSAHEWFFKPADYRMTWWRWSRLAALTEVKAKPEFGNPNNPAVFRIPDERAQVTLRLLRKMHQEVAATGAEFYILHLPRLADMDMLKRKQPLPYHDLLAALEREHTVIRPEAAMLEAAEKNPENVPKHLHYPSGLNKPVGRVIADFVINRKR